MYKYFVAIVLGSLLISGCEKAERNTSANNVSAADSSLLQSLEKKVWPLPASTDNPVDTLISIEFDAAPTLGHGEIYIMDAADDSVADIIQVDGEVDFLGVDPQHLRTVKTRQVRINGNRLIIQPHQGALGYGKGYYTVVPAEALVSAKLDGKAFQGISKSAGWKFSIRDAAPATNSLVVSQDSKGDFYTLQGALNHAMQNIGVDEPVSIDLKNGIYEEILFLRGKNNITLRGEDREKTVIQYLNNNTLSPGTGRSGPADEAPGGRSVFLVEETDMLVLENLTIKNTTLIGEGGQAETIYFNSEGRLIGKYINLISEQDTLLVKGYNWFYDSLIAGNVDFIWGMSRVSLFENCEIRTLGDSRGTGGGGYILQARNGNPEDKGFVFLNSSLTHGEGPLGHKVPEHAAWLARSGGSADYFDNIAFVNTRVDRHIHPNGWNDSRTANPAKPHVHGGWRQYNIMNLAGEPLDISGWQLGYTLTEAEYQAEFSSREVLFSTWNNGEGWNPQP